MQRWGQQMWTEGTVTSWLCCQGDGSGSNGLTYAGHPVLQSCLSSRRQRAALISATSHFIKLQEYDTVDVKVILETNSLISEICVSFKLFFKNHLFPIMNCKVN